MTKPDTSTADNKSPKMIWAVTWEQQHWGKYTRGAWSYTSVPNHTSYTRTDIHADVVEALDGLLIALSTGKGIAEATDTAKAAMRRPTQGENQ